MRADLIAPRDPRWHVLLEGGRHDVYHLPDYVTFASGAEQGTAAAFLVEAKDSCVLAPVVLRRIDVGVALGAPLQDAIAPYGYPSPIVRCGDVGRLSEMLKDMCELAAANSIVSGFFRLHPMIPLQLDVLRSYGEVVAHGETVWVDLAQERQAVEAGIRDGHRYDIKRLVRTGYTAEIGDWSRYADFIEVYLETMRRVGATSYYMFSREYFEGLRSALGESVTLCTVSAPDGTLAAGGLFSEHRGIVQYLFSGTVEAHVRAAPSKLLVHAMINWAHARGNDILHLGGGVGGREDSLFRFKAGFSKSRAPFHTWRVIFDPITYSRLAEARISPPPRDASFFPAYRAP